MPVSAVGGAGRYHIQLGRWIMGQIDQGRPAPDYCLPSGGHRRVESRRRKLPQMPRQSYLVARPVIFFITVGHHPFFCHR